METFQLNLVYFPLTVKRLLTKYYLHLLKQKTCRIPTFDCFVAFLTSQYNNIVQKIHFFIYHLFSILFITKTNH